jgi:hypothetical protein
LIEVRAVSPTTVERPPPPAPRPRRRPELVVSPELALVDPELRAEALARLPRLRPYEFLERQREPLPEPPWFFAPSPAAPYVPPRPNVAVAAAAYLAAAILRTCAFNALVFVGVAAVVLLVNVFA